MAFLTSGPFNTGGIVDIPLLITQFLKSRKSQIFRMESLMEFFVILAQCN